MSETEKLMRVMEAKIKQLQAKLTANAKRELSQIGNSPMSLCPDCYNTILGGECLGCRISNLQAELEAKDKALDEMQRYGCFVRDDENDHLCLVVRENEKLQAELDKHRWIPVSERVPENNECVFITIKHMADTWGFLAWYSPTKVKWEFYDNMVKGEVTHWKPIILPKETPCKKD